MRVPVDVKTCLSVEEYFVLHGLRTTAYRLEGAGPTLDSALGVLRSPGDHSTLDTFRAEYGAGIEMGSLPPREGLVDRDEVVRGAALEIATYRTIVAGSRHLGRAVDIALDVKVSHDQDFDNAEWTDIDVCCICDAKAIFIECKFMGPDALARQIEEIIEKKASLMSVGDFNPAYVRNLAILPWADRLPDDQAFDVARRLLYEAGHEFGLELLFGNKLGRNLNQLVAQIVRRMKGHWAWRM
jgi:hypothetical protein